MVVSVDTVLMNQNMKKVINGYQKNSIRLTNRGELDLHGVKHSDVEDTLLDWIHFQSLPATIITGNSNQMKNIVKRILSANNYSYIIGDNFNQGYIKVMYYESKV